MKANKIVKSIENVLKTLDESKNTRGFYITHLVKKLVNKIIGKSDVHYSDRYIHLEEAVDLEDIIGILSEDEQNQLIEELGGNVESGLLNVLGEELGYDRNAISIFMKGIATYNRTRKDETQGNWQAYLNLGKIVDDEILKIMYFEKAIKYAPEDKKSDLNYEICIMLFDLSFEYEKEGDKQNLKKANYFYKKALRHYESIEDKSDLKGIIEDKIWFKNEKAS